MDDRAELRDILQAKSLLRGNFVLSSGKLSDYYLDCKRTTLGSPRGLHLIAKIAFERIRRMKPRPDAIGGLTIGAAPISIAVSQLALEHGWSLPVFVVRDEQKSHGTKKTIEGDDADIKKGVNVVIVDDVITTGDSVLKAISAVKERGAEISKVIVLIDREEGGLDNLKTYDVETIFTIKELRG